VINLRSTLGVLAVMIFVLAACGGEDDATDGSQTTPAPGAESQVQGDPADVPSEDDATQQAEELAEGLVESLEQQQDATGGGGATLTVGDMVWTFDSVLCAFGPDQIGQEGAEFVLSAIQDGLQLYVSIDSFGDSVSINDVTDFQNPSVSLSASAFTAAQSGAPEEFVEVNGKDVTSTALFIDDTTDDLVSIEGTLTATCP
jgi:hypothetical protein